MTFEDQLVSTIKQSVLNEVKNTAFLQIQYNQKKALPDGVLDKIWAEINWDEVVATVRVSVQTRICNSIVGAMDTEVKTDIKALLSVDGVRQKLRMQVYPHLMQVLNGENK